MKKNYKILIVDDDENLLIIFEKLLSTAGYHIFTAQNGTEAIEMAKKHRPQLVLLDVILPDISGIEVMKTLKKQPETQHCFVVLISSKLVSSEDRSEGLETGADDYLLKPIQNRELVARVDSFMRHKTSIDNLIKSEEHFRVTLNSIGDAVITTDTAGRITSMNPVAAELTGWSLEEANNEKLENVFKIENAQTGDKVENPVSKVLKTGGLVGLANHTKLISKNGKEFQIADSAAPIKNDEGKVIGVVLVFRDVTEEYRIHQELKESEEKYRLLIENQTDLIVKVDAEGKFLFVSPSYCKMFGKTEKELLGKVFIPLVHKEDRGPTIQAMENLKKSPHNVYVEQRAMTKNGWRWLAWVDTAITGENGKIKEIIGVGRDVTERKKAETELAHSHELMRYIIEHANSAVAVHDRDLNYIYVSQRYLDQFNVKEKDVIGRHHYDVFPDLPQKWRDVHKKALRGEVSKAERDPYYRDDGTVVWTRWECRPWYEEGGSIGGFAIYTEVITERIEAENALKESESRFSIAFEASPAPLVISEIETGQFIDVNNRWVEMLGYSREEQIGKTSKEVGIWRNPSERDRIIQHVIKEGFFKDEFIEFNTKTGETILALWSAETIVLNGKRLMLSMIHDITERIKAEEVLRKLKDSLQEEVEKKTKELIERVEILERFQEATIEREFRIKELKEEIKRLKAEKN